jgi:hypothetical protein
MSDIKAAMTLVIETVLAAETIGCPILV